MSMSLPPDLARQRWTPERVRAELLRDDRPTPRYECIDGELLVSPSSPGRPHQRVVRDLILALHPYVEAQRVGELLHSPSDVQLGPDSLVQPDLYVVAPDGFRAPPARPYDRLILAIEVLSPSTARHDRMKKRHHYLRSGVAEYWIVDLEARLVERTWPDGRVDVLDEQLRWEPPGAAEPLALDLAALFRRSLGDPPPDA